MGLLAVSDAAANGFLGGREIGVSVVARQHYNLSDSLS